MYPTPYQIGANRAMREKTAVLRAISAAARAGFSRLTGGIGGAYTKAINATMPRSVLGSDWKSEVWRRGMGFGLFDGTINAATAEPGDNRFVSGLKGFGSGFLIGAGSGLTGTGMAKLTKKPALKNIVSNAAMFGGYSGLYAEPGQGLSSAALGAAGGALGGWMSHMATTPRLKAMQGIRGTMARTGLSTGGIVAPMVGPSLVAGAMASGQPTQPTQPVNNYSQQPQPNTFL